MKKHKKPLALILTVATVVSANAANNYLKNKSVAKKTKFKKDKKEITEKLDNTVGKPQTRQQKQAQDVLATDAAIRMNKNPKLSVQNVMPIKPKSPRASQKAEQTLVKVEVKEQKERKEADTSGKELVKSIEKDVKKEKGFVSKLGDKMIGGSSIATTTISEVGSVARTGLAIDAEKQVMLDKNQTDAIVNVIQNPNISEENKGKFLDIHEKNKKREQTNFFVKACAVTGIGAGAVGGTLTVASTYLTAVAANEFYIGIAGATVGPALQVGAAYLGLG